MVAEAAKKADGQICPAYTPSRSAVNPYIPVLIGDTGFEIAYITIPRHNVGPICDE